MCMYDQKESKSCLYDQKPRQSVQVLNTYMYNTTYMFYLPALLIIQTVIGINFFSMGQWPPFLPCQWDIFDMNGP